MSTENKKPIPVLTDRPTTKIIDLDEERKKRRPKPSDIYRPGI